MRILWKQFISKSGPNGRLDEQLNEFSRNHEIIFVQYSSAGTANGIYYSALVQYENSEKPVNSHHCEYL